MPSHATFYTPIINLPITTGTKLQKNKGLNLYCDVRTVLSAFREASKDHSHKVSQKPMKKRDNENMLIKDSTELQIAVDAIEKGGILPQALNMVNVCSRQQNLDEVTESCVAGVMSHLQPKRTALLK